MTTEARCTLCGEPMPAGEEMFKYHGYSGPCPSDPMPQKDEPLRDRIAKHLMVHASQPGASWDALDVADVVLRALEPTEEEREAAIERMAEAIEGALDEYMRGTDFLVLARAAYEAERA